MKDLLTKIKQNVSISTQDTLPLITQHYIIDSVNDNTSKQQKLQVHKFEVGCAVQYGDPVQYGTIKQIVMPPGYGEQCARIEWVNIVATVLRCVIKYSTLKHVT